MIRLEWNSMIASELSPNNASRHHHMQLAKKRKKLKNDTTLMLKDVEMPPWSPMDKVTIKYIAYYCGKPLDRDNLIAGMKSIVDGVVAAGVIPDDGPDHLLGFDVEYHKMHRMKDRRLAMEITEVK
jgi:hypothetical protein